MTLPDASAQLSTPTRLFDPITLRGVEIRNRLWQSPMCQYSVAARDGIATDWHLLHYGSLARGGVGLSVVEASSVTVDGRISAQDLGIWDDAQVPQLARIVELVHGFGAKAGIQLAHAGRKASTRPTLPGVQVGALTADEGGWQTVSASDEPFGEFPAPRALLAEELPALVAAFLAAAERAVRAGFDLVEVHAAHGYLLHQFLSPISNHRSDAYGGDLVGRARLLREIVQAIRAAHPGLPLLVRVSATDWLPGGLTVEETTVVAGWLREDGADLIDVSSAAIVPSAPIPIRPSYQVPLAAQVRRAGLPVAAVGLITQAAQAESIVTTGQADAVFVGRELLRDPNTPLHWARELRAELDPIVPAPYFRAFL